MTLGRRLFGTQNGFHILGVDADIDGNCEEDYKTWFTSFKNYISNTIYYGEVPKTVLIPSFMVESDNCVFDRDHKYNYMVEDLRNWFKSQDLNLALHGDYGLYVVDLLAKTKTMDQIYVDNL